MLSRCARLALLLSSILSVLCVAFFPRAARADQPGAHTVPVAVLAFDSDDSEDQAEAITGAIRSRVRAAQGWSLIETNQSLGMLTAAFKCPTRPTPECQQKIADQIKAERYIYGYVTKGPLANQVTAEVHLFQRGKPEAPIIKEPYADNLRDPNDDTLRKIAARIVERLGGASLGVIVVRSSEPTGEVIVDGEKHVPLDKGAARIELSAGSHSVELSVVGGAGSRRNVLVVAGRDTVVELTATAAPTRTPGTTAETRGNGRKVAGGVTMGAGVVLGAVAVIELVRYLGLQDDGDARAAELDKNNPQDGTKECREYDPRCKQINRDSKVASGLAIGLGAGGAVAVGVGAYLFFTDPGGSEKATARNKTRLVPSVGPGSGTLTVLGTF
ncbi:MAG: hypothetical protein JWP97_5553 [Labilithrix sp.]|nr:hypothetical protein [Labilithrix sp.]